MKAKILTYFLFFIGVSFLISACNRGKTNKTYITKRIQYDVRIVSPGSDYKWYIQNIEGMEREKFIRKILSQTYEGKVKAYNFFTLEKMSLDMVKAIGNRIDSTVVQSNEPPYQNIDTIMKSKLDLHEITHIRFLEEWKWNDGLEIEKEVVGICPLLNNYDPNGDFRGYQPMFWVFFKENYPADLSGFSNEL